MSPGPRALRSGFSLLEVLVAMVILTVGATSLIAVFATAAATHKRSVDRTHAAIVAEEILSEIQARYVPGASIDEIESSLLGEVPETIDGYQWDVLLVRPAEEGKSPPAMARARKAASPAGGKPKTATRPLGTKGAGRIAGKRAPSRVAESDGSEWSEEEVLARVMVFWSESGRRMAETFDTILLPRPITSQHLRRNASK